MLVRLAPFVVLAGAAAAVAPRAQAATQALVPLEVLSFSDRLAVAAYGWCYYLWRFFWPVELSPLYELPLEVGWSELPFSLALVVTLLVVVVLGLLAVASLRRRTPKKPWLSLLAAALALYTALLLPVLGFFQSGMQLVADRYSYLPSIVLAAALAPWLARFLARRRNMGRVLCGAFALALMAATFNYSMAWRSTLELWQTAVAAQPECNFCREGLGTELLRAGEYDQAESELIRVLEVRPNLSTARRALAALYEATGRDVEALQEYQRALALTPGNTILQDKVRELSARVGELGSP